MINKKLKNSEMERLSIAEYQQAVKMPIVIVLDNVRSLNNIGSVFRTADALRLEGIYLCGITATPPHKDLHKTALGAEDAVPWLYFENTIDAVESLKKEEYIIYSIEQTQNSQLLSDLKLENTEKYALIFGNEVKGVSQEVIDVSDGVTEIPQLGTKHSLNISVSVGVVLWEFYRQLKVK